MPRFGAYFWSFCLHFDPFILFHSFNFDYFRPSRPLTRHNFYWLVLKWAFLLSFLQKWLICEMKFRNRIMTVCKHAYRNLKLQTNKPLYLVGPQKIKKKKVWDGLAGKSVPWVCTISQEYNIKLSSTDHGLVRYVPFSNLFSKNLSFWRRGFSDYIC